MTSETKPTSTPSMRLSGNLGVGSIVFMVVAAAAPLTVIAGVVPAGIALGNGASFPATYIIATAVLLLFAVGFTAMSRHIKDAGAFYTYIARGLGRRSGVGGAFLALLSYATVQLAVWGFIGAATADLVVSFGGPNVPWWAWAFLCQAVVAYLGYRNIDLSGKVLGVLLVAEVAIVLIVDAFVIGRGGTSEGLSTGFLDVGGFFSGAPGIAIAFAVAGYIGFEATAIFRDEARDPDRTIPRATYVALLLIGGFYGLSSWALVSAWGDSQAITQISGGATIVDVANTYISVVAGDLVRVLLVTSLFAAALSFHNVLARYLHALGRSQVLPRALGESHQHHLSPHAASVVQSVAAALWLGICIVVGLDPVAQIFTWFAGVAAVGITVLMLLTSVAVIFFFARRQGLTDRWHAAVAPGLGAIGLAGFLVMTIDNLPLMVGGNTTFAWIIVISLTLSFIVGFLLAGSRPHIARDTLEEIA
ncbi:amino acid permease [Epidermidibacterium keratini]|uniref:Amino acid permease n=1 Tax=Epidermidibacterium keratini TaxID=1891644 RepID=A0A7L4YJV1_9ACTN|nr:APC family permease [Epidermidibacterium keratini]QHB99172.1 amino acid permease [Epidermidibacterium keratini]